MVMETSVFPLNTVLFPGGLLPLRIFEPRYVDMVRDCLKNDKGFVVCLIREGKEVGEAAKIFHTGTLAKIVDWETLPDGLLGINAHGEVKVLVSESRIEANQLLVGDVDFLPEEQNAELPQEYTPLSELLRKIIIQLDTPFSEMPAHYQQANWVGSRLTEFLPIEVEKKQRLLELNDPIARLRKLHDEVIPLGLL